MVKITATFVNRKPVIIDLADGTSIHLRPGQSSDSIEDSLVNTDPISNKAKEGLIKIQPVADAPAATSAPSFNHLKDIIANV